MSDRHVSKSASVIVDIPDRFDWASAITTMLIGKSTMASSMVLMLSSGFKPPITIKYRAWGSMATFGRVDVAAKLFILYAGTPSGEPMALSGGRYCRLICTGPLPPLRAALRASFISRFE